MPPHEDERTGRRATHLARRFEDAVVLERVHAGDADEPRPRSPYPRGDTRVEAQIQDRRRMSAGEESRSDVLEAERLDPEEWSEPEAFVAGIGAQEQDVHGVAGL